jgi:membrane protease subunit HflK
MAGRGDQGGDPWGGGDGGLPPEIEKILKKVTSIFKGGRFNILIIIGAIVLGWIVFSSAYTVGVDEVGVIQRVGKYVRTT